MIRVASQLTFCTPEKILRRMVVEQNEQNIITNFFSLDEGNVETSHTLFFDGIISSGIVSVKQNIHSENSHDLLKDYQYFDFTQSIPLFEIKQTNKPLIMDFGTNSPEMINSFIPILAQLLLSFSIFEIIAACTYYPSVLLGRNSGLAENTYSEIILWENVDLIKKKLLVNTHVLGMNRFS